MELIFLARADKFLITPLISSTYYCCAWLCMVVVICMSLSSIYIINKMTVLIGMIAFDHELVITVDLLSLYEILVH